MCPDAGEEFVNLFYADDKAVLEDLQVVRFWHHINTNWGNICDILRVSSKLQRFEVFNGRISNSAMEAVEYVLPSCCQQLTQLVLENFEISETAFHKFCCLLPRLKHLKILSLSEFNAFGNVNSLVMMFAAALGRSSVTTLHLDGCCLDDSSLKLLGPALRGISQLYLGYNRFSSLGLLYMTQAHLPALASLDVSGISQSPSCQKEFVDNIVKFVGEFLPNLESISGLDPDDDNEVITGQHLRDMYAKRQCARYTDSEEEHVGDPRVHISDTDQGKGECEPFTKKARL